MSFCRPFVLSLISLVLRYKISTTARVLFGYHGCQGQGLGARARQKKKTRQRQVKPRPMGIAPARA